MNDLPNLAELIVHEAPMILLDELVDAGPNQVHCRVTIQESGLFFDAQTRVVPGYVGIEFMAQAVAVWAGYHAWKRGEKPPIGFLLGGRNYQCETSAFVEGMELDIHAEQLMKSENMASFRCSIQHNGVVQATCDLNVYEPPPEEQAKLNHREEVK